MSYSDTSVALCALNKLFGYQPVKGLSLLEEAPDPVSLFDGTYSELLNQEQLEWARRELARVEKEGYRFISLRDEDYPAPLSELPDPPLGLYINGTSTPTEILGLRPMIGIVGTRDISPYGREWCRKLVEALSATAVRPCIVSGLAFGADGIAHQSALDLGLCTVGVMATGIETVYPWQHEKLAVNMVKTPGCGLITDYPMETAPTATNFLRRNRIIAGLCSAVLVVESKSRGGSLMTARYAVEYNRDVFALPGRVDDVRSAGCNSLIACDMARLISSPEELIGELGMGRRVRGAGGSWQSAHTEESLRRHLTHVFGSPEAPAVTVGLAIRAHRGTTADELTAFTGLSIGTVQQSISLLEAQGIIYTDFLRRCALTALYA